MWTLSARFALLSAINKRNFLYFHITDKHTLEKRRSSSRKYTQIIVEITVEINDKHYIDTSSVKVSCCISCCIPYRHGRHVSGRFRSFVGFQINKLKVTAVATATTATSKFNVGQRRANLFQTSCMGLNPLQYKGNNYYSATWKNIKLVHWPLTGELLHLVQRGGDWAGCGHPASVARYGGVATSLGRTYGYRLPHGLWHSTLEKIQVVTSLFTLKVYHV